jgi:AraC-like DNA-binding protein
MEYVILPPCEELRDYVSHFWVSRLNSYEQANFIYYSTANTNTELAFAFKAPHLGHSELVFSSVLGHTTTFAQLPSNGFLDILGASLYSYAVPCFLDVSPSDLMNRFADIESILPHKGKLINEKMTHALTAHDRLGVLTDYFKAQLRKKRFEDPVIVNAIRYVRKHSGMVTISELASQFCLSQKQFERRFTAYSGFKPKLYSRIVRFESALWNSKNYNTLTEAACAYGYYDQAHFIHDFKKFGGFAPNHFFSLAGY